MSLIGERKTELNNDAGRSLKCRSWLLSGLERDKSKGDKVLVTDYV